MQLTVSGHTLTLSILRLGAIRQLMPQVKLLRQLDTDALPSSEQIDAMIAIVHAGAMPAQPDLTVEQVRDWFDAEDWDVGLKALTNAFQHVMQRSGFVGVAPAGEAQPAPSLISERSTG